MAHNVTCPECYPLTVPFCNSSFEIPTGQSIGTTLSWKLTDKFGNEFTGSDETDVDGNIQLNKSEFPEGMFTPYSGGIKVEVYSGEVDECNSLTLVICGTNYECVTLHFKEINETDPTPY